MNHNQKSIKIQQNISKKKLKNLSTDFIYTQLRELNSSEVINEHLSSNRNRIYTPMQTLSMFISQAINPDSSCQRIVDAFALQNKASLSISTGGYCRARQRLPEPLISKLAKRVASLNESKIKNEWKFKGKDIYLVDGTTFTMPDSAENQAEYPQPSFQKKGIGFPICRAVGIISLATGCIIDAAVSPFHGKGASEQILLRSMLKTFKKGDLILADAFYSTYSLLAYVIKHGIDIVFVQHGQRIKTTNFNKGKILGENDHIITITKPKVIPAGMSEDDFENMPNELTIRELKVGGKVLITTFLCEKKASPKILKNLYKQRWHIEVDFRNIKSTLGLKMFSCKTPEMVMKEMWTYFLAYNLIRLLMLESALYNKLLPRQLSFKHTIQLFVGYSMSTDKKIYQKLLILIGKKIIGNREGRIEPRAIKKRHNNFPLLMKHRNIARAEISLNGHPKKLK